MKRNKNRHKTIEDIPVKKVKNLKELIRKSRLLGVRAVIKEEMFKC